MLPPLPTEIFDLIVDHLHDELTTLKACCLVSKSWVPRARRYIFAQVMFNSLRSSIQTWMEHFPDPSNSPAHHTRALLFVDPDSIVAAFTVAPTWLHYFCHVKELRMANILPDNSIPASFVQLHGFSPTLKLLHLFYVSVPLPEILDLICSFPLLEDLCLQLVTTRGDAGGRDTPSTSPRLTGCLTVVDLPPPVMRGLLDLPNGLHFAQITASCHVANTGSVADLISRCSDTLESLTIAFNSPC